ncbi:hypothetical protein [Fortiea sp. LEGE XX443]|nr:hypothetical protein [Fortiea sp. LEGE XX443]
MISYIGWSRRGYLPVGVDILWIAYTRVAQERSHSLPQSHAK